MFERQTKISEIQVTILTLAGWKFTTSAREAWGTFRRSLLSSGVEKELAQESMKSTVALLGIRPTVQ